MRLSALIAALPDELAATAWLGEESSRDPLIRGIAYDSRQVSPGDLFVALAGSVSDGHAYIRRAMELGAAAILIESIPEPGLDANWPTVVVPDSRRALAPIAVRFFGQPAEELRLIGITGTNGKTSTGYLVEAILQRAGILPGLIGTVEIRYANERIPAVNTTPESLDLQRILRSMCTRNIEAAVMEVSSHGLELGRVRGCQFEVAAFTNLTQDHLDFHPNMAAYLDSKARLFREHLAEGGHAVINADDPASATLLEAAQRVGARALRCSRDPSSKAEIKLLDSEIRLSGTRARLEIEGEPLDIDLPLLGDFNLENLLVACGIGHALAIEPAHIAAGVAACPQVPGRMEVVSSTDPASPVAIVDYAHTPDAIEKLLQAVRPLCDGRLITVFGCGGDRDRSKRPRMAEAVARGSDLAIATSDNPRTEDPGQILHDVEQGLGSLETRRPEDLGDTGRGYAILEDRRSAIQRAIGIAEPQDTVVIAGKGHEDYQILGREKFPFDDRDEARKALEQRGPS
ncbi:MAG: UDP-N-acetylmuramoyl-L-alanyl-D-glutamate--2,6-diaminopimelate ligase [Myxococcota bacterium]|jgi:UDP-N-acetylmuramoyl-L-alanyl-D-glutamate--2,6-diaminopimelate ligase|nr:UDP-N-acetylmuramoyl-L-alanyl-D-glutamate--2,6-diaminopimelate ligase [Myxococcota bacterium]